MRIMVQIKATLVLKKILVYLEVHEFSELDVPLGALLLLSKTRIACIDATEFLSDVYKVVHERKNP